ncbi:replication initiation factor domain-containing protein [Streptococcus suis]|uniref:replication initiation factor domain-containing protein n=1 Tax=Streptococcus suis TaxID=1307 RepID=UPI0019153801|nr:replication initiation factor domain-containing protein [Streptococcus suis]MBS8099962.1 replication initiation factor domain-containing protein [Streptococcus suis]MBS8108552.1 replication initiation factor domain-containing protein [Streptococcus suis]MBS8114728.1 replication initiation factor domain-containing protein [Streptococcus suis]MBS8117464.1 replication initiation factor domain-containing protein [Streptococcus suis]MCK3970480.1 replication initiation factor domain-containing pr
MLEGRRFQVLKLLGYDIDDFQSISGRFFYNAGLTLGNYVNVYYNEHKIEKIKGSTDTVTYVFTGQGCTDLYEKIDGDWAQLFKSLISINANITRLDIALDDFVGLLKFPTILSKLNLGHYKSPKKAHNIVRSSDVNRNEKGLTIYIGSSRNSSSKGNYYCRMYDKKAQYLEKHQQIPEEIEKADFWQRYEISYTKKKSQKIAELLAGGESVDKVYKQSMSKLVTFLVPTKNKDGQLYENKSDWKVCSWWSKFLETDEKIGFENPERDIDLGGLLRWLQVSVMPNIKNLERIGYRFGFDIYSMMKDFPIDEFSKKQERLYNSLNTKKVSNIDNSNVAQAIRKQNQQVTREVERAFQRFKDKGY